MGESLGAVPALGAGLQTRRDGDRQVSIIAKETI
jgi:hypothetical protein